SKQEIKLIIYYWIRTLAVRDGWDCFLDIVVVNNVKFFFINIIMTTIIVNLIQVNDNFDSNCYRGINENEQILSLYGHSNWVYCVKFPLFYKHMGRNVICSASLDETIRFWDIEKKSQFDILHGYKNGVFCIEFSPLEANQYLFSGCGDNNIYLWDISLSNLVNIYRLHTRTVRCLDCEPLNVSNLGVIGGNGFSFCSGSYDNTIRVWDLNTCKPLLTINAHKNGITSVKYGSNKLETKGGSNLILSGSWDNNIHLHDVRYNKVVGSLYGHKCENIESGDYSNMICSGSYDNTIRFWDIRSC
ncbi:WD-40 repeat protein, partial [Reticulomyxa filosa]